MNEDTRERLFGYWHAFDQPVTAWICAGIGSALLLAIVIVTLLGRTGRLQPGTRRELRLRILSWVVMTPLLIGPVLLGAAWTIAAVAVLGILCYREFARATGLFREHLVSGLVVLGMIALTLATIDHWYDLFMALMPLTVVLIAGIAVIADDPRGYIQRTALGVFAFLFFGACIAHFGYFANDPGYRPVVLLLLVAVELNDVFAYVSGRLFGRRKLMPMTSPNKTWAGALGAMLLTTLLVTTVGPFVFGDAPAGRTGNLVLLGLLVAVGGQLGDLMLSAIKRDLGIKDFAATIPGHGGLLDRFDSLLLVAPAAFHYIGYLQGIGVHSQARIFTGA